MPVALFEDAINRFRNEVLRVLGVLEIRLSAIYAGGEQRANISAAGKAQAVRNR